MWELAIVDIIKTIYKQSSIVDAVNNGPAGLINVKLKNGKYLIDIKNISEFSNKKKIV